MDALTPLGLMLLGGVVGGWFARQVRLPTLTGYIAAGVLLGHHGFTVIPLDTAKTFHGPVNDLAMALVLFVLGGQFRVSNLEGRGRKLFLASLTESFFTFALVATLCAAVLPSLPGAMLLGVLAIAVAPATTIVVLREYHAQGPTTDVLKLLTALSNVWSVLAFELAMLALLALSGGDASPLEVFWDVGGALAFGLVAGHVLILLQERTGRGNYAVPLLTVLLLTIGACRATDVPHMLAFLVTGAVVANRSRFFDPISEGMDVFAQPAFVLFFVLGGLELDFGVMADNALAVGLYVLARVLGKIIGARLGLRVTRLRLPGLDGKGSPPIGLGLLCQAGAAIALAGYVGKYDAALSREILNIVLGAVVVFELAGPLLVRTVAVSAGEVSLGQLLRSGTERSSGPSWWRAIRRTLASVRPEHGHDEDLEVSRIMNPVRNALPARAGLDEILKFANQSPFNHFPVVDDDERLIGVLRLQDLEQVAYDKRTAQLVVAADLCTLTAEEAALPADAHLRDAIELFRRFEGNTAAVVQSKDEPVLLGMLERAEVLHLARALQARDEAGDDED